MKTTVEIPDALFRKAKSKAAERGQTLKQYLTEALQAKLSLPLKRARAGEPPWMHGFGKLRQLRKETRRIQAKIDAGFEAIEPDARSSSATRTATPDDWRPLARTSRCRPP